MSFTRKRRTPWSTRARAQSLEQGGGGLLYLVDGHVRVYHGSGPSCRATTDYWVNQPEGSPTVGVALALVRCLAAFLSGMALGLGFFWVAWSKDRQSWHDKIASTLIVKTPSGMPLI